MTIVHVFKPTYWSVHFAGTYVNDTPKRIDKAKEWALSEKADICYNLAFFNLSTKVTENYVKGNYKDFGYGGIPERLTVSPGNICGGYALGIKNGEIIMGTGDGRSRTRNGIGVTKLGSIVIAQSTHKITERNFCKEVATQVASYFKDCVNFFLMEDGGSSTQSYSNFSKLTIAPEGGRKVATVSCVNLKIPLKITKTLKVGCTGEDVRMLQMILGGLVCDGSYGNATKDRVKAAQKALEIKVDGSCGPITLKALGLA